METMTLDQEFAESEPYEFSLNDRCDADKGSMRNDGKGVGVAEHAKYRLTKGNLELFLCIHHFNKHEDALLTDGWKVEKSPVVDTYGVKNYIYSEQ